MSHVHFQEHLLYRITR